MAAGRAKGRTVTLQQSPVLAPHLARGTGARGDQTRLHRTRSSVQLLTKHLFPWDFVPPSPHGQHSPQFLTPPALALPAGSQLWVSPVVTAGPWRDQTISGVLEATRWVEAGQSRVQLAQPMDTGWAQPPFLTPPVLSVSRLAWGNLQTGMGLPGRME